MIAAVAALSVIVFAQGVSINVGAGRPQRDSADRRIRVESDSARRVRVVRDSIRSARREERTVVATAEHLASAFTDERAGGLLAQARVARLTQDSMLLSYAASSSERATVGMALTRFSRERILFRYERAARVRWQRDGGARVEITGERTTAPMLGGERVNIDLGSVPPIPYFPGREPLLGFALARANVSDRDVANPLASGAEAYYTYTTGDSAVFRLPNGQAITLRELRVRPRRPSWRVLVASLWFDTANGRLVRAVYRFSEPMDIWEVAREEEGENPCDAPRVICAAMTPMVADVPVVTVEYGLHEGRFWLPRNQMIEGHARVGLMRFPIRFEQSYRYESVNGLVETLPVSVSVADTAQDSLSRVRRIEARRASCAGGAEYRERVLTRFDNTLPVAVRVPCDSLALARSSDLPESPFAEGEELFGSAERDELVSMALELADEVRGGPQRPRFTPWLRTLRYNRIEGLSGGVAATQALGSGFAARGELRVSLADRQVNGELGLARSDGRRELGGAVYRRLAVATDWGEPLGFGNSVSALLFGRDEGFYYRSVGAELTRTPVQGRGIFARAFVERHDSAGVEAASSLARVLNDRRFQPNIAASEGTVAGAALRWFGSRGLDPRGFRLLSDVRMEGAAGSFDYTRASADFTVSRPLMRKIDGALTLAGGTSGGTPPVQRWWFLGGAHTVRGQPFGSVGGNSFWMGRAELGSSFVLARPVVFADIGWAGDRTLFGTPGKPISGAGVGVSLLDGMIRFDLAKGIHPNRTPRGYLYLEARF